MLSKAKTISKLCAFNYTKKWWPWFKLKHMFSCWSFILLSMLVNLRASPNVCLANCVLEYTPLWQPALWLLHKLCLEHSKSPWIPSVVDLKLMCHQHLWLHGDLALHWGVSFTFPLPHLPTMMANPSQWPNSEPKKKKKTKKMHFLHFLFFKTLKFFLLNFT